ncbi:MAG: hypothetical protein JWO47_498 [Candidatus Saccharibacteria bacterium]|nr:hypothetical protein [Candidatus Saccharibacteria bacterium]
MGQKRHTVGKQEHQSIIEFNGQRFNARTGRLIDGISAPISPTKPTISDMAPANHASRALTPSKQVHKTLQPSKTLMRRAVQKPSTITDRKTVAMDVVSHTPGQTAVEKFHSVSAERDLRAGKIRQNSLVNRFGGELHASKSVIAPEKLNMLPEEQTVREVLASPLLSAKYDNRSATSKMLDKSLRSATSHEEKPIKKAKLHHRLGSKVGLSAKAASIAAGSLAVLLVGGFVAYQNIPNLSIRYASAKAGVHASLPTYQPAGFAINSHVGYSPGVISVAYKANADNRAYTITQKTTNWNSDALKEHLMGTTGIIPQSYPDNGQTIYLHDNNQADWVNNGVWYSITGNSNLNTDQLIKIATSL